jgi:methylase of polypeptide subunit release factors
MASSARTLPQPPDRASGTVRRTRFGTLDIAYDDRVLRPRRWTTRQSRWAADLLVAAPPGPVLELCAGAGQIGLLAVAIVPRRLVCIDLDPVACDYARTNAEAAGIADRVEVRQGDVAEVLQPDELFSVVIADPPYLLPEEAASYPEDPPLAVDGGPDGLAVARRCLDTIERHLLAGGSALLQLRTDEQVTRLRDHVDQTGELVLTERRTCGRGVLARFERR